MAAISVGSVEVDVVPNTRGIRARLQQGLVPAANEVGEEMARVIGRHITTQVAQAVRNGVTAGARTATPAAVRGGQQTGSAFGRSMRAAVAAALRDLPEVELNADSTDAQREIHAIRAQLQALSDMNVGVDIDAAEATARIARLQERLQRLAASDVDVDVRMDVGAASAQLAAFQAQVNRLDGQTANVRVDTRSAAANLSLLTQSALLFGPAIIPVLPVVAAGLGAVAAAASAAAVGFGAVALVAAPAFMQIGKTLQAQKAAQDAATDATLRGGQAAAQASSRALQLASAQAAVASAERNGARQIAQAQQQVTQARRNAAQAAAQASLRTQQAARAVEDAEEALADAQRDARRAQEDLTAARRTAAQELEDLNSRLANSVLSQKDAELALREATAERDAVLQNANATELDKERALLTYDQAVQRLKDQTTETQRLKAETAKANKAGVDGSETVRTAQERLAEAQEQVADRTQGLRDAQAEQARTATENAQQLAEAQERIADAQRGVAEAQVQAAEQAAAAQRQLEQAQNAATGAVDQAAIAEAKYQQELAKLTPAARETMNAYTGLKDAFGEWSKSLQPAVMPIFTRALEGMTRALPGLTPFALEAAAAIKGLQDRASEGFKKPWWQEFKADLETAIGPAITGLGVAFGNVFKGMVGVIGAFLPHMDSISRKMQDVTSRFATWGQGLKGSPEFERFLSYSSEHAPLIADTLGKIAGAILSIGTALSPVSGPLLQVVGAVASAVGWVAETFPGVILLMWGFFAASRAIALGLLAWQAAQWLVNGAMAAFAVISKFGPWGWIVLAITGVVLAVMYLWENFEWFREAVLTIWEGIKTGAQGVIDWFAGPFTRFFTETIPAVFQSTMDWVKTNWPWILGALGGPIGLAVVAIIKHWDDIKAGISDAWTWIKQNVLYPIRDFFTKTVPGWGTLLKTAMIGAFDEARKGIKTAWDKIKQITKAPVQFVVDVVYNNGIRKVWNLVVKAFGGDELDEMKFARGGITPGYTPGRDVHTFVSPTGGALQLSGGEAIMRPEWTRAVGAGYVNAMNSAARSGGVGGVRSMLGFKDGGILDGIGDVLGGAWDKVKAGASWLKDSFSGALRSGVEHVVNPLINKIPGGDIGFVGLLKSLMRRGVKNMLGVGKKADAQITPHVKYSPTRGVEQWRGVVLQALREVGQPSSLADTTLRRMQQESGGNPTIVNKWDSNWQAGHPSVGLMQVIGPTFRAYAGKYLKRGPFSYGVSVDPLANIYSSMRYALSVYGSLSKAYNRPGGYDSGGYLQPGMNLAYNGTGRPEPVFTTAQSNALTSLAARGVQQPAGLQPGDQLRLVVDDHEFTAYIDNRADGRVQRGQQQLVSILNAS